MQALMQTACDALGRLTAFLRTPKVEAPVCNTCGSQVWVCAACGVRTQGKGQGKPDQEDADSDGHYAPWRVKGGSKGSCKGKEGTEPSSRRRKLMSDLDLHHCESCESGWVSIEALHFPECWQCYNEHSD